MNQGAVINDINLKIDTNGVGAITGAIANDVLINTIFLNIEQRELVGLGPQTGAFAPNDTILITLSKLYNNMAAIPIVNVGTNNYVQKAFGGDLMDSLIQDNGTGVGIGTTVNPGYMLSVAGGFTQLTSGAVQTGVYSDGSQSSLVGYDTATGEFNQFIVEPGNGITMTTTNSAGTDSSFMFFSVQTVTVTGNGTNNAMIVYDGIAGKGLVYSSDYSANFTNESLITKRYVDTALSGISTTLTAVLSTGNTTGEQDITSDDGFSILSIYDGSIWAGSGDGSLYLAPGEALLYATDAGFFVSDGIVFSPRRVHIATAATTILHNAEVNISAPAIVLDGDVTVTSGNFIKGGTGWIDFYNQVGVALTSDSGAYVTPYVWVDSTTGMSARPTVGFYEDGTYSKMIQLVQGEAADVVTILGFRGIRVFDDAMLLSHPDEIKIKTAYAEMDADGVGIYANVGDLDFWGNANAMLYTNDGGVYVGNAKVDLNHAILNEFTAPDNNIYGNLTVESANGLNSIRLRDTFGKITYQDGSTILSEVTVGGNISLYSEDTILGDYYYFNVNALGASNTQMEAGSSSATFAGIKYSSDYSANYVNRSLVDKEYVDDAIAAATPSISLQSVVSTGNTSTGYSILFSTGYGIDSIATGGSDVLNIGATNANVINYGNASTTHNFIGTALYELQVNTYVTDKLVTLNSGGAAASATDAGIEFEEGGSITAYIKTTATRNSFIVKTPAINYTSELSLALLTADRVHTMPDNSGTIALLSDITGVGTTELAAVISQTNTPPAHVAGERYLVGTVPTGAWVGNANSIAESDGAAWIYTVPVTNNTVFVTATLTTLRFNGTSWIAYNGTAVLHNGNTLAAALSIGTNDNYDLNFKRNGVARLSVTSTTIKTGLGTPVFTNAFQIASATNDATTASIGISNTSAGAAAVSQISLSESSSKYLSIIRYSSTFTGNITGTSIPFANLSSFGSRTTTVLGDGTVAILGSPIVNITGSTSTNLGTRLDTVGFRVGAINTLHSANTVTFQAGVNLTYADATCIMTQSATVNNRIASEIVNLSGGAAGYAELRVGNSTYFTIKRIYGTGYVGSGLVTSNLCLDFNSSPVGQLFYNSASGTYFKWAIGGIAVGNEVMHLDVNGLKIATQVGTGSRMVEADFNGLQTAVKEIIEGDLVAGGTAALLLENVANWTGVNYTGTAITGTYSGQRHYDATYKFEAMADNLWIRTARA